MKINSNHIAKKIEVLDSSVENLENHQQTEKNKSVMEN